MFSSVDKAVEALLRGQECANYLKMVFEHSKTTSVQTEPLLDTVLDSFADALSFFTNFTSCDSLQRHESSDNLAAHVARKSPKRKSSGEEGSENYSVDSTTPLSNDGFSWRKYGQKKIMSSPHPRCYYRCAYAKDQNCNASKRVQQIQHNPSIYRTTYVGKHVCEVNSFSQPDDDTSNGATMIRFDNFDQVMSESATPQHVSVDHQEIIEDNGPNQTMSQEFDTNDFLMDGEQLWGSQSPENIMSLDDISVFDYKFEI